MLDALTVAADEAALPPWVEVHPENYFCNAAARAALMQLVGRVPISLHGVGLSLGSVERPDATHLRHLKTLAEAVSSALISDHVAWSAHRGRYSNDLLPLPYTAGTLALLVRNIGIVQDFLGRAIAVENPATYLRFEESTFSEPEFLAALAARTGCALLMDVNNLYVSGTNHGWDMQAYLAQLPSAAMVEYHLAGHTEKHFADGTQLLIDTHDAPVSPAVLALFRDCVAWHGMRPTLLEWDADLPEFAALCAHARAIEQAVTGAIPHPAQVAYG